MKRSTAGCGASAPASLQPAATVSVLAACTSVEMMCDAPSSLASSAQDSASVEASEKGSANAESSVESLLLHLGLVFAPAVTPEAAAVASCMHILAFARRYAGIGYPAGPAYLPAWAEHPCMMVLPKCMHQTIVRSLVRTRLASTEDAAEPDARPLWVLSELMRRCSEAAAGIVVHYAAEGAHVTYLEAPAGSSVAGAESSARKNAHAQSQSHQPLLELLLCIVCFAAAQGGLAITDADRVLASAACSTANDAAGAEPSHCARRAMTCLSAAAASSPYAPAHPLVGGAVSGSPPRTHVAHAHVMREVIHLCRSHLEHVLWSLAVRFWAISPTSLCVLPTTNTTVQEHL